MKNKICILLLFVGFSILLTGCNKSVIYGSIVENNKGETVYIYPHEVDGNKPEPVNTFVTYAPCQPIVISTGKHMVKFKVLNIVTDIEKEHIIEMKIKNRTEYLTTLTNGIVEIKTK